MKILFAAPEVMPFCKTGGLADVVGALAPVLADMGHDVHIMLPGYRAVDRARHAFVEHAEKYHVRVGNHTVPLGVSTALWNGVNVHLLENRGYFDREGLYGDSDGDYIDNGSRFIFFSKAVLETAKRLKIKPDIIHAHDWQAGLAMAYLATVFRNEPCFEHTGTLFTIHNLGYQGLFPYEVFSLSGIPEEEYRWTKLEYYGKVSFIKGGIVYADAVSTVSKAYADEITGKELGFGLEGVFSERRKDLYGILNGIDMDAWNPATDRILPAMYSHDDLSGKKTCRRKLLSMCGLEASGTVPVLGMVTRLDDQKGLDILEAGVDRLMSLGVRLIILGTGTKEHHETMKHLAAQYPGNIRIMMKFDNDLAHRIYAGADAFLMPSRYEPCGLGQLISMRYGTLPVVHATGGFIDTVCDLDEHKRNGNGFSFREYSPEALVETVMRAVKVFGKAGRKRWNSAVQRAMAQDFSWKNSAREYIKVYEHIRNRRNR